MLWDRYILNVPSLQMSINDMSLIILASLINSPILDVEFVLKI